MLESQHSRYGAIAKSYSMISPVAKIFFAIHPSAEHVSSSTNGWMADFANEFPVDRDGVVRVHSTMTAAHDATTSGRGDIVYVGPGKWKEEVLVTHIGVRFIGPGFGTGYDGARIRMSDASTHYPIGSLTLGASSGAGFTIVAKGVEVTGFYFDGGGGYSGIYVGGGLYSTSSGYTTANASGAWIHHNFFRGGSEGDYGIFSDGPRFGCVFEDNIFERQTEAGIYLTPGNASNECTVVRRNMFLADNGGYGIFIYGSSNASLGGMIHSNVFADRTSHTFTYAIKNNGSDGVTNYTDNWFCCANTLVAAATDFCSGNHYGWAGSATEASNYFITEAAAGAEA